MAYATSLQGRWARAGSKALAVERERLLLDYRAKVRPVGLTVDEARALLVVTDSAVSATLRGARRKLLDWIARYDGPNTLECLACSYVWISPLPRGRKPKRCQCCGIHADEEGETMIIAAREAV